MAGAASGTPVGSSGFADAGDGAQVDAASVASDAVGPQVADAGSDAADAQTQMPGVVVCSGPQDCMNSPLFSFDLDSGARFLAPAACCVANTCIFGHEAAGSSCGEPDAQVIAATSYDLSCATDSDCTLVALGDFCHPGANGCPLGTISLRALPKYNADVARTYAVRCGGPGFGDCPVADVACCRNGQCVTTATPGGCFSPEDTLPACANAGGLCEPTGTVGVRAMCTVDGPPDSCAYPDETCCLDNLPCPGITSFTITPAELLGTQPSMVSITTAGHVSSIAWTASSCNNFPGGAYPASGQIGGFADPSSASTTFNCGTCTGQVAITATIASDEVAPGSDAATNACLGAPFTTFTGLVNCQLSGALPCPGAAAPDLCFGACTSLNADRNNCGTCGNVCAGGSSCNSGVCSP
jgi:hypothetical protein